MTLKDFYRILSLVRNMRWQLVANPPERFGVPSKTTYIYGERGVMFFSPESAVAVAVKRRHIDWTNERVVRRTLHLRARDWNKVRMAAMGKAGYSRIVRNRLLKACRLPLEGTLTK